MQAEEHGDREKTRYERIACDRNNKRKIAKNKFKQNKRIKTTNVKKQKRKKIGFPQEWKE